MIGFDNNRSFLTQGEFSVEKKQNVVRRTREIPTYIGKHPGFGVLIPGLVLEIDMRLTLRTLLSYLDDTLEPAQAKAIGAKVAESDTARELADRIKQVTRRRRLTAPPTSGPGGIDPNTIAEYRDNDVTAEQSTEVE